MAGLSEVPCLLYCGLTPEEECLLDRWDNEMDEEHKPVYFLEDAEHYKFLKDTKGWSIRQIARNKNTDRNTVFRRLKIADISQEAKRLIWGVSTGDTFVEGHFREICKLKCPGHTTLIIKEIIERRQAAEAEETDENGVHTRAMKQKDVARRVAELLELETRGEITPQVAVLVSNSKPEELEKHVENSTSLDISASPPVTPPSEEPREMDNEEEAYVRKWKQELNEELQVKGSLGVSSKERSTDAMKFDIVPRWLKWSSLPEELGPLWAPLDELIKHEMRYKYLNSLQLSADRYFYIDTEEKTPQGTYNYLGVILRLKPSTVERKLRRLEKWGLLQIQRAVLPKYPRFQIYWEHIKQLYDIEGWKISFEEGGMKNITSDYTGPIEPTPYHTIWVRNGVIKEGLDPMGAEARKGLKALGASPRLIIKLFKEHTPEMMVRQLEELPRRIESQEQQKGKKKDKPLTLFLRGLN